MRNEIKEGDIAIWIEIPNKYIGVPHILKVALIDDDEQYAELYVIWKYTILDMERVLISDIRKATKVEIKELKFRNR